MAEIKKRAGSNPLGFIRDAREEEEGLSKEKDAEKTDSAPIIRKAGASARRSPGLKRQSGSDNDAQIIKKSTSGARKLSGLTRNTSPISRKKETKSKYQPWQGQQEEAAELQEISVAIETEEAQENSIEPAPPVQEEVKVGETAATEAAEEEVKVEETAATEAAEEEVSHPEISNQYETMEETVEEQTTKLE
ncbi:MAG: hypothetical protein HQM14_21250, partial [SAR324 cluster bacterium]|nr:hypothetical protein [SAR324 cluster bacterium]